jgi:putative sterol carrier protein|tara:strand:+ start:27883 stop:28200 length:318 start_codon:yes stop_codon:yes gene_type:complete
MSILIKTILTKINKKLNGCRFEGSIKIEIYDEGSIFINEDGASTIDTKVDCIMSSDVETFKGVQSGHIKATNAFMTGKLKIDGNMSIAIKLANILSSKKSAETQD